MGKQRGGRQKGAGKELEITQRRARVASMILAGVSYRQIAEREGVALATVAADKAAIVAEWQEAYLGDVAAEMAIDLRRLDDLITRITVSLQTGGADPSLAMVFIRALERRARMLGYDARDRREQPVHFAALEEPAPPTYGVITDEEGNQFSAKNPVEAVFALLGGRRQSGKTPGEEGDGDHDQEIEADRQRGRG